MRFWQSWSHSLLLPRRNENPDLGSGYIFFVGNATLLIRYAGFTILTDPNFLHAGDHAHLGYGLTSTPLEDFKQAVSEAGLEDRVHYLSHGDTYEFEVPDARGEA
jgi:hypothetical protein